MVSANSYGTRCIGACATSRLPSAALPQTTADVVEQLERGMESYARVLEKTFGDFDAQAPGMGAAGGLGAAARAFLTFVAFSVLTTRSPTQL